MTRKIEGKQLHEVSLEEGWIEGPRIGGGVPFYRGVLWKPLSGFPSWLIKPIKSAESMGLRAVPESRSAMIHVVRPERPVSFVHAGGRTAGH